MIWNFAELIYRMATLCTIVVNWTQGFKFWILNQKYAYGARMRTKLKIDVERQLNLHQCRCWTSINDVKQRITFINVNVERQLTISTIVDVLMIIQYHCQAMNITVSYGSTHMLQCGLEWVSCQSRDWRQQSESWTRSNKVSYYKLMIL